MLKHNEYIIDCPIAGKTTLSCEPGFGKFLQTQLPIISSVRTKKHVLHYILKNFNLPKNSLILEFGVGKGKTIRYIAKQCPEHKVYGFDSFLGIPEDFFGGQNLFKKGSFSLKGKPPKTPFNVELVTGWFKETLPQFLKNHVQPISFIHFDCDLYSSTIDVLRLVKPQLTKDTIFIFDEFLSYTHEARAFYEFLLESNFQYQWLCFGYSAGIETDVFDTNSFSEAILRLKTKIFCRLHHNAPCRTSAVAVKLS